MMSWEIEPYVQWIALHVHWAYAFAFTISLAESLFIVGFFVPGVPVMTALGSLMGSGVLPLVPTLLSAVLGAVAGDGISFWLGKHHQDRVRNWRWTQKYPQLIARGEALFRQHGGKSILLGRFVGPVRPVVPAIAGMMRMPTGQFLWCNVASALLWAPVYCLPGALIGSSFSWV